MEIQNISGADAVPSGFTVNSTTVPTETENTEQQARAERETAPPPPEENRGRNIDTYA